MLPRHVRLIIQSFGVMARVLALDVVRASCTCVGLSAYQSIDVLAQYVTVYPRSCR
jgi:hypothetical protein